MAAILDLINFHSFKGLEKNAIPFFLITTMFQKGINKKITFSKHFARKYIRAYTIMGCSWLQCSYKKGGILLSVDAFKEKNKLSLDPSSRPPAAWSELL